PPSPSRLTVHLGEHDIFSSEGTEQHIPVAKAINHPGYDEGTTDNDFMLIKLQRPAQFNQYVQPIRLASSCAAAGTPCLISGWGNQIINGVFNPFNLQCVDLPILSDEACENSYPGQITSTMVCAGYLEGGKDSCQGDSGGPLVCNGELQGIVSWGYQCAQIGHPSVYVRVCRYNAWISQVMSSN
ncbi:Trypsin-3, partial [Acipenser ruthenus]